MKAMLLFVFLLPSILLTQNSDWAYSNPYPQTDFYAIKFFNQSTGYVIGSDGILLKNISGSANWINIPTNTTRDLYAMHFFDVNTGYIAGDGGLILYTSTAGTSWTSVATNNGYAFRSITFINQNTGFAAGDHGELFKTTSGITGWQPYTVTTTNLRYIYFYDSLTGYVCGDSGKVLKTTNCGTNWRVLTAGTENLYSVSFINALTGYMTARLGSMKTTDGGNTWSSFQVGYAGEENIVKFVNANTGYVCGKNGPISRTINGGQVWQPWCSYQLFYGNKFNDISIVDSATSYVCGANGWVIKCYGTDNQNQFAYNLGGSGSNLSRISFTSSSTGAMMGDGSLLFTTTTGGDKWDILFNGSNSWFEGSINLTGLWLYSPTSWYRKMYSPGIGGFSSTGIQQSTDGGLTWEGNRAYSTYSLGVANLDVFETGGISYLTSYSNILKNSGTGWSTIYTGSPTGYIYFADASTGFVSISPNGTKAILYTSNGGTNWVNYSTGSTKYIESVYLRSSGLGFIGCDSALLLKTTNFGLNWNQIPVPNNLHVQNVRFVNESRGWFLGTDHSYSGNGRLFVTNNGGSTFQQLQSLENFNVKGYSFIDALNGFVCGDSGMVLKTTNGGLTFVNVNTGIIPEKYSLSQNYPNPFNPVTNIKFDLPRSGYVEIKIFDIRGREIAQLVNQQLQPGVYSVDWDASSYPSGVYFYRIEAGKYREAKRMVLIK